MKKDTRNLLAVLGVAVLSAFALTAWFVYAYGPTGSYTAQSALLQPALLAKLNYNDINPKTEESDRYEFDKIIYSFWDSAKQEWGELEIALPFYEQFYSLIQGDKSLENPSHEIVALFSRTPPAKLIMKVKTESSTAWQKNSKEFQRVDFAENSNYYRIQLHEDKAGVHFVYFYHDKIYQKTYQLFHP